MNNFESMPPLRMRLLSDEMVTQQTVDSCLMMNWCRSLLRFFRSDSGWERPQTNGVIEATRDDERPVSGEFHCGDAVSGEIAALEESRLLTTGSQTVFSERWKRRVERNSSDWCAWCSGRISTGLWRLLLFLRPNNSDSNL